MSSSDFKSDVPQIEPKELKELILQSIQSPSEYHVMISEERYSFIKISKSEEHANYYIFAYHSDSDVLGTGTSNRVIKGWKLESDDQGNRQYLPIAVNIVNENKISFEQVKIAEKINKLFYKDTEPAVRHPETKEIFLITKRLLNEPLVDKGVLSPSIAKLPFTKKLEFITNILVQIKTMHDRGYIHGDLTAQNILLERAKNEFKNGEADILPHLIDFNNSKHISKGGEASVGTPGHIAPESLRDVFSEATDIFSIAPDFMIILGATNPYIDKLAARNASSDMDVANQAEIKKEFNMLGIDKMLQGVELSPKAKAYFTKTIHFFLSSMANSDPQSRPTVDQCLRFFHGTQNILERELHQKKTFWGPFFPGKESAVASLEKLQQENNPGMRLKK